MARNKKTKKKIIKKKKRNPKKYTRPAPRFIKQKTLDKFKKKQIQKPKYSHTQLRKKKDSKSIQKNKHSHKLLGEGPRPIENKHRDPNASPSRIYLDKQIESLRTTFQIAKDDLTISLQYINGPVSFYAEKLPTGQLVLLFGDVHESRENMLQTCLVREGCLHIADFIKLWARATKEQGEIYMESAYVGVHSTDKYHDLYYKSSSYENESILLETTQVFTKCFLKGHCLWNDNILFNYLDIRLTDIIGIMLNELTNLPESERRFQIYSKFYKNMERILDLVITSNNIIFDLEELLDYVFVLKYYERKNESVIKIELQSCSKNIQDKIISFTIQQIKNQISKDDKFKNSPRDFLENIIFKGTIKLLNIWLMDMYTLCRMFRTTNKSRVWIMQAGDMHVENILKFLIKKMNSSTLRSIPRRKDPYIRYVEVGAPNEPLIRLV